MPIQLDIRIEGELPPAVEAAAYYVCAEAVTNAVKHAGCSTIHVNAVRQAGVLTVEVVDDGVGGASFDGDGTSTGLRGLRDRVEAVDAVLTVESASGRGTRVAASFPLTG
jgi:signal transduction histidine kinase